MVSACLHRQGYCIQFPPSASLVVSAGDPGLTIEMPIIVCRPPSLSLPFQAVLSLESHRDRLPLTPSAVPCVVKSSPQLKQMAPAQAPLVGLSERSASSSSHGLGQILGML